MRVLLLPTVALLALLAVLGCGGGDNASPTASPAANASATPTPEGQTPQPTAIVPPLEGPPRGVAAEGTVDYRQLPEWQLPDPQDLPPPPADAGGPEFNPPQPAAECPAGWQAQQRPQEGFSICYPQDWRIEGHGYVAAINEDQWYSLGLVLFQDQRQVAHVSVYMVPPLARPFTYTRDCRQAYSVTFAGEPAALCPDYPGNPPEARIIAYHVRRGERDYFVNVVPYFLYDADTGRYGDSISDDALATAIEVAHTFQFIPLASQ